MRHCERGLYQTKDSIRLANETLLKTIGQWLLEGSGWSINEVFAHELLMAKCVNQSDGVMSASSQSPAQH